MLKLKMDLSSPNKKRCKIRENDRKFFVVLKYVPSRLRPPHATPCHPMPNGTGKWAAVLVELGLCSGFTQSVHPTDSLWTQALVDEGSDNVLVQSVYRVFVATLSGCGRTPSGTPSAPSSALHLPSHHRNETEQGLQAGT